MDEPPVRHCGAVAAHAEHQYSVPVGWAPGVAAFTCSGASKARKGGNPNAHLNGHYGKRK